QPGAKFTKTWRVRNTGESAWGSGYMLAFIGDSSLDGPGTVPLPPTEPGKTADVSVELTAPVTPGRHRSSWQARSAAGDPFGDILRVDIEVARLGVLDDAKFVSDVTFPDGQV